MAQYWFRPKRFWNWFAAYYPSSFAGWLVTVLLVATLCFDARWAIAHSRTISAGLLSVAPVVLGLTIIFDVLCRLYGEYPSWWRHQ